jgi:hypothetical protein
MKRIFQLGMVVPFLSGLLLYAQPTQPTTQKPSDRSSDAKETKEAVPDDKDKRTAPQDTETVGRKHADDVVSANHTNETFVNRQVEVLSDTMGVDFGPYLPNVLHRVRLHWYHMIPSVARSPIMRTGRFVTCNSLRVPVMYRWIVPLGAESRPRTPSQHCPLSLGVSTSLCASISYITLIRSSPIIRM